MQVQMQTQIAPQVGCCKAIGLAFKHYANCNGRSRRSEFWYFQLFVYGIIIHLSFIAFCCQINSNHYQYSKYEQMYHIFNGINSLFTLAIIIPYVSLCVRRLHDTGQSGFLFFIYFIPLAGPFILLYFCSIDSDQNTNEYGPSPKYILPQNVPLNPNDSAYGIPVNPYPQQNQMPPQVNPYPQQNQMPPQVNPYPQPNQMPPQVNPYPQPNQIPPQVNPYPQPNQIPPQVNHNPQTKFLLK